jgi:Na+-translocating ferredoxin:NAD+ oxidoreductase RnfC subunit
MRAVHAGLDEASYSLAMGFLCSLCGVCEAYACTMGLSPRRVFQAFKGKLAAAKAQNPYRERPGSVLDAQSWSRVPKQRLTDRLALRPYLLPATGEMLRVPAAREVRVLLKQHVGAPAMPLVKPGDMVRAGQVIGEIPEGSLGARVHATIDGTVTAVDARQVVITRGRDHG